MKRILTVVALSIALAGCGDSKIDGRTEDSYKASVTKIGEGLPEPKKKEFSESLAVIAMSKVNFADVLSGKVKSDSFVADAMRSLDGKTADQVIDEAGKIRAAREAKEKEQALGEMQELVKRRESAEKDKSELDKFSVTKSRFSQRPQEYSSHPQPIIDLSVTNGTSHAISRAYFKGTIASPGRSVPWFSDDFNYPISGGLEPGEKANWSLAPNRFSEWGKVDAPADAVLTVEVVRLDGPDNKKLFDSNSFSEDDLKRLKALQEKYSSN